MQQATLRQSICSERIENHMYLASDPLILLDKFNASLFTQYRFTGSDSTPDGNPLKLIRYRVKNYRARLASAKGPNIYVNRLRLILTWYDQNDGSDLSY